MTESTWDLSASNKNVANEHVRFARIFTGVQCKGGNELEFTETSLVGLELKGN